MLTRGFVLLVASTLIYESNATNPLSIHRRQVVSNRFTQHRKSERKQKQEYRQIVPDLHDNAIGNLKTEDVEFFNRLLFSESMSITTSAPSTAPSVEPTTSPSKAPSASPSHSPSLEPSTSPSYLPSALPSYLPSYDPTGQPTEAPSPAPTKVPTKEIGRAHV